MQLATLFWIAEDFMLPCLTKKFLGFDCPGCGLQRSVAFLLQGDFVAAFEMYPAIYAILLLLGFVLLNHIVQIRNNTKIIIFLAITSISFIIGNYILKFI